MLTAHAAEMFHVQTIPLPIFLVGVFLGAILHNLLYWSFIQSRVLKYSKILFILPALLFAAAHLYEGSMSAINGFVEGLIMSLVLLRTKNIATTVSMDFARLFSILGLLYLGLI